MIIVEFNGGLGNQMFQYALYLQLKECGRSVKSTLPISGSFFHKTKNL